MSYHHEEIGTLTIQEHTVEATTANGTKADTDALLNSGTPKGRSAELDASSNPEYNSASIVPIRPNTFPN